MTARHLIVASAALALVASCGGPSIIDDAKNARLAECPSNDIGTIVNNFYNTTSWTAYKGETETTKEVYAEGEIMFAGAYKTARLGFLYDETTGQVTLMGVDFSGQDQPMGIATALIEKMCEEAR